MTIIYRNVQCCKYFPLPFQYPHLVHAAVASSAPVKAQLNFQGYNDVVAASFGNPMVGGSKEVGLDVLYPSPSPTCTTLCSSSSKHWKFHGWRV